MGFAKSLYLDYLDFQRRQEEDAKYEEAQSRLRMSMTCCAFVRPLLYPLGMRIVELALSQSLQNAPR